MSIVQFGLSSLDGRVKARSIYIIEIIRVFEHRELKFGAIR